MWPSEIPAPLETVLRGALAKDPTLRSTADALAVRQRTQRPAASRGPRTHAAFALIFGNSSRPPARARAPPRPPQINPWWLDKD